MPCIAEFPSFIELKNKLNNDEYEFIFVSRESYKVLKLFLLNKNLSLPLYSVNLDKLNSIFIQDAIPVTYIIPNKALFILKSSVSANWSNKELISFLKK